MANCSGRGVCRDGRCLCQESYVLADCSARDIAVNPDHILSGVLSVSQWDYYHISVHTGNALLVECTELDAYSVGNVWLFVRINELPTLHLFDKSDTFVTANHSILMKSVAADVVLYIGVYGSALMSAQSPNARYQLKVSTGCSTYKQCNLCITDPDCGWCYTNPFNTNNSVGVCVAGTPQSPNSNSYCGTWVFSTCDPSVQQALSLNLGIGIGVAIGLVVLGSVAAIGYAINKKVEADQREELLRLQNLDQQDE